MKFHDTNGVKMRLFSRLKKPHVDEDTQDVIIAGAVVGLIGLPCTGLMTAGGMMMALGVLSALTPGPQQIAAFPMLAVSGPMMLMGGAGLALTIGFGVSTN